MFGWFKKDASLERPEEDTKGLVTHHYEGGVLSPEYNVNNPEEYPYHALYPHGEGKITYKYGDEVLESYEGEFEVGQYSGRGRLEKNGKVYEGFFSDNKYLVGLEDKD